MITPLAVLRILAYLAVEAAILLTSLRLVATLCAHEETGWSERAVLSLYTAIAIKSTLALLLTYLKLNDPLPYLAASFTALILACRGKPADLAADLQNTFQPLAQLGNTETFLVGIAVVFLSPVVVSSIRPTIETDSLFIFNPMLDWLKGVATPYSSYLLGYTGYWELSFLPAMSVAGTDQLLWLNSLLAVIGILLAQFALARQMGLDVRVAFLLAIAGISLKYYWVDTSGVATFKNDMLQAGGFLLLCIGGLRVIHSRFTPATGLMLFHGLLGASAKYGGLITALVELGLLALICAGPLWQARRSVLRWSLLSGMGLLGGTGGYYLRNAIVYSNPLYPMQIDLPGGLALPGLLSLEGTAITDNLLDPDLWRTLSNEFYVGGIALPFSILAGVLLVLGAMLIAAHKAILKKEPSISKETWFLVTSMAIGLALYARSFWSAGRGYGDYTYLAQLNTLRYGSAWVLVAETLIVALIGRAGIDQPYLAVLPGLLAGSRLQHLYAHEIGAAANAPYYSLGPVAVFGALSLALLASRNRRHWRPWLALACIVGAALISPLIFERNRAHWLPQWAPAWGRFLETEGVHVGVLYGSREESWPTALAVTGRRFQNEVTLLTKADLQRDASAAPDTIVRLANPFLAPNIDAAAQDATLLEQHGYTLEIWTEYVIIASKSE